MTESAAEIAVPISVIIPARNEASFIGRTLQELLRLLHGGEIEVVVVDNESTDETSRIAAAHNVSVLRVAAPTIGALRNRGVAASRGSVLLFLDADVVLTDAWAERFPQTLRALLNSPRQLTGAMCTVPSRPSWIERVWFAPRDMMTSPHIGTGHLITTRAFFDELGGFDDSLATGEDYDFSQRALLAGGSVNPDPLLVAEHHGFPSTIGAFVRREAWHGRSDFESFGRMLGSRVALATLVFGVGLLLTTGALLAGTWWLALLGALLVFALCFASSAAKFRRQPVSIVLANTAVFHAYYFGRLLALLRLPVNRASPRVSAASS